MNTLQAISRICLFSIAMFTCCYQQNVNAKQPSLSIISSQEQKQRKAKNTCNKKKLSNKTQEETSSPSLPLDIEIDYDPCGKINFSKTTRKLEKNIVVFLIYSGKNLSTAKVRLTCKYKESNMSQETTDPLMSTVTFKRLMQKLELLKNIGTFIKSGPDVSIGPLIRHSDVYTNAVVEWFEYSCEAQDSVSDCGVRRFNVHYTQ